MFHTNKMPKIIVFRVVIEGTAPTEGSPTACHGKRPSCPKRAQRPPAYPAMGSALPVPSTPAPAFSSSPERERLHPASTPAKAIFGRIFAPVSSFKLRLL